MNTLVRSTTLSLKFCNLAKREIFKKFVDDYSNILQQTVDELFLKEKVPLFFSASNFNTTLTATTLQAIGKQASQIVRGEKSLAKKQKRQPTKPTIKNTVIDLDERFVSLEIDTKGEFDAWLTVRRFESLGIRKSVKIEAPLRKTNCFNKFISDGWTLKKGVKFNLKMNCLVFHFERQISLKTKGETIGIDVGIVDVTTDSRGNRSSIKKHPHGWTLTKVLQNLNRKKKGSKGFKKASDLRDNFIGWSINHFNFENVKEIKLENIKNMKKGKRTDCFRNSWSYPKIFDRLNRKAEEQNVFVSFVNPRNTSRKCSICGVVNKQSRKGKSFKCVACGYTADADFNAALNIKCSPIISMKRGAYSPSYKKAK
jgi:transposase